MVLILAHYYDKEAAWLADKLADAFLLVPEALGVDYDITLRLSDREIRAALHPLQGGREFSSPDVSFMLNRLSFIDPLVWKKADETERTYVTGEINAFFAAFIHAFSCPVVNPVVNGSLMESSSRNFSLIMVLQKMGMTIHPALLQENGEAFHTMLRHLADCTRMMTFGDKIFVAPRESITGPQDCIPEPEISSTLPEKPTGSVISALALTRLKRTLKAALKVTTRTEPPGDAVHDTRYSRSGNGVPHSLEFFFREAEGHYELIFISRMPALSLYEQQLLPFLRQIIKNHSV